MASASSHNGQVEDEEKSGEIHRTTTAVTMPSELFEKVSAFCWASLPYVVDFATPNHPNTLQLYFTPKIPHYGDKRANPTALGFVG